MNEICMHVYVHTFIELNTQSTPIRDDEDDEEMVDSFGDDDGQNNETNPGDAALNPTEKALDMKGGAEVTNTATLTIPKEHEDEKEFAVPTSMESENALDESKDEHMNRSQDDEKKEDAVITATVTSTHPQKKQEDEKESLLPITKKKHKIIPGGYEGERVKVNSNGQFQLCI